VWATKDQQPRLDKKIRSELFPHIKENAKTKNIFIDTIGGHDEHIHTLISLDPTQSISNILNLIKGESSHWLNKSKLIKDKFEWQDDYFAVSVSPSVVEKVRDYILNQEIHHQKKTYEQEFEEFIKSCGLEL
jgi:REP element-mobilizing transposase RayT